MKLKQISKRALSIVLTVLMVISTMIIGTVTTSASIGTGVVYFDNTDTKWTQPYMFVGHNKSTGGYLYGYKMTQVEGKTNIWTNSISGWDDAEGFYFADGYGSDTTYNNGGGSSKNITSTASDMGISNRTSTMTSFTASQCFVPSSGSGTSITGSWMSVDEAIASHSSGGTITDTNLINILNKSKYSFYIASYSGDSGPDLTNGSTTYYILGNWKQNNYTIGSYTTYKLGYVTITSEQRGSYLYITNNRSGGWAGKKNTSIATANGGEIFYASDSVGVVSATTASTTLSASSVTKGTSVSVSSTLSSTKSSYNQALNVEYYLYDGSNYSLIAETAASSTSLSGVTIDTSGLEEGKTYTVKTLLDDGNVQYVADQNDTIYIEAEATTPHNITKASATNGSFTVAVDGTEVTEATKNKTVTVTATPSAGYKCTGVTVTGTSGATVEVKQDTTDKSKYTFTMPDEAVEVSVTFGERQFFIGGRFGVKSKADGTETVIGTPDWSPKDNTIAFTSQGNGLYKLETGYTLKEISAKSQWYFGVNDGETYYGSNVTSNNTIFTESDAGVKTTANTGTNQDHNFIFSDSSSTSENEVVLWVNASDSGNPIVYFTLDDNFVKYNVNCEQNLTGGSVSVDKSTARVGSTVTITATAAANYTVGEVTAAKADGTKLTVTNNTFTMPDSTVTVSATFNYNKYYLTGSVALLGTGSSDFESATMLEFGAPNADGIYSKTFNGVAAGTYEFKVTNGIWSGSTGGNDWGANGKNAAYGGSNYSFTVAKANSKVIITFNPADSTANAAEWQIISKPTFTLTKTGNGGGSVTVKTSGNVEVAENDEVTAGTTYLITVTPEVGSEITSVTVNGSQATSANVLNTSAAQTYQYQMTDSDAGLAVAAEFALIDYTITKTGDAKCSVTADATANYGATVNFTINVTDDAYKAKSVVIQKEDGTDVSTAVGLTYTQGETSGYFTMPDYNVEIVAASEAKPVHDITYSSDAAGCTVTGASSAYEGQSVTVTATAATGYKISSVTATTGGVSLTDNGNGTYTFTMGTEPVTISGSFVTKPNTQYKLIGLDDKWYTDTTYTDAQRFENAGGPAFTEIGDTGVFYAYVENTTASTKYFKIMSDDYSTDNAQFGPDTYGRVINEASKSSPYSATPCGYGYGNAWNLNASSKIFILFNPETQQIWSESAMWYLNGFLNNADVTSTDANFRLHPTTEDNIFEITLTFTDDKNGCQYLWFNNGTNTYGPSNYELVTESTWSTETGNTSKSQKWGIAAAKDTPVTITWDAKNHIVKWNKTIDTSGLKVIIYQGAQYIYKEKTADAKEHYGMNRANSGFTDLGNGDAVADQKAYFGLDTEAVSVITRIRNEFCYDATNKYYQFGLQGYSVLVTDNNGKEYIYSLMNLGSRNDVSKLGDGKYSASFTVPTLANGAYAVKIEITPIFSVSSEYAAANGIEYTRVYLKYQPGTGSFATSEPKYYSWRSNVPTIATASDGTTNKIDDTYSNGTILIDDKFIERQPEGTYDGQKMLYLSGDMYTVLVQSELQGILFASDKNDIQTFDFDEFIHLQKLGYDNITFEVKEYIGVDSSGNPVAYGDAVANACNTKYATQGNEVNINSAVDSSVSSVITDANINTDFEIDTNIEGYVIDVFGNKLVDSNGNPIELEKVAGATTTEKLANIRTMITKGSDPYLMGARYGDAGNDYNASLVNGIGYGMAYPIRVYYIDSNNTLVSRVISGYGQIEGNSSKISGYTNVQLDSLYVTDTDDTTNRLITWDYYTGTNTAASLTAQKFVADDGTITNTISDAYEGVPYLVSYKSMVNNRVDGKWYYQRDIAQVGISLQTAVLGSDGKPVADTACGKASIQTPAGDTVATDTTGLASAYVDQGSTPAFNAESSAGYQFLGFYTADGALIANYTPYNEYPVGYEQTVYAVFEQLASGTLVVKNNLYRGDKPANGEGTGTYAVTLYVGDSADGPFTAAAKGTSSSAAITENQYYYFVLTAKPAGVDKFVAFRQPEYNAAGELLNYTELKTTGSLATDASTGITSFTSTPVQWDGTTNLINLYTDFRKVSSTATLNYNYIDRFGNQKTYVKKVELSYAEIDNNFIPSTQTIQNNAPYIDEVFKDCTWKIVSVETAHTSSDGKFSKDASVATLQAVQNPKTVTTYYESSSTTQPEGIISSFNGDITLTTATQNAAGKNFLYWVQYNCSDSGAKTGNAAIFSYEQNIQVKATFTRYFKAVYVGDAEESLAADFSTNLHAPEYTREHSTDADGKNEKDYVYSDFLVQFLSASNQTALMGDNVKIGVVTEMDYNQATSSPYDGTGTMTAPVTATEGYTDSVKTTIANMLTSGKTGDWNATTDSTAPNYNYWYALYDLTASKSSLSEDFGRLNFVIKTDNTEYNRGVVYNVYTYIAVSDSSGGYTVYLSDPQVMNIYAAGTTAAVKDVVTA